MDIENLTRRQLSHCFGCTEQTVSRWRSMGMPRATNKRYNLTACLQWRTDQLKAAGRADPNRQLERLRRHKADLAKLEYAKRAGELVRRDVAARVFRESILIAKTRLMALPAEVGNRLSGSIDHETIAVVTDTMRRAITEALRELAAAREVE